MDCPKCQSSMETISYGAGDRQIERCTHCIGIWFKPNDVKRLKNTFKADILDQGSSKMGRLYNKIDEIDCPVCGTRMDKVSDEKQTHIWYESCPNEHGMFFDAGEFTDLNNDTLSDYVKKWITGKRGV